MRDARTFVAWALALMAVVLAMGVAVRAGLLTEFDEGGLDRVRALAGLPETPLSWGDRYGYVDTLGPLAAVLGLAVFVVFRTPGWLLIVAAPWAAAGTAFVLKRIFATDRPELAGVLAPSSPAYPSGHATVSAGLLATLVVVGWNSWWRWPLLLLALVWNVDVALARMYGGVHWPSDVVAGLILGCAVALGLGAVGAALKLTRSRNPNLR